MSARFEELDWAETPLGTLVLRRRFDPVAEAEVYEVKLGDEYLMSSLFTTAEIELSRLGLAAVAAAEIDVVVAGLGLGYTAGAVLDDSRVRSLTVVEALPEVIEWHRRRLLPEAARLTGDPRVGFVNADFFEVVSSGQGLDPPGGDQRFHAVLVDIDHSPRQVLDPSHTPFYQPDGLRRLGRLLHPDGVLALWSDDPPDASFQQALEDVFTAAEAHVVEFANPFTGGSSANTVFVGQGTRHGR